MKREQSKSGKTLSGHLSAIKLTGDHTQNGKMFGAPGDVFDPERRLGVPTFGTVGPSGSTNQALDGGSGHTGQNYLYAVGGRSGQFTIKLLF